MMMCSWTDNPVMDAEAYYAACEERQAQWEAGCKECAICGKILDPHEESYCYGDEIHYIHPDCFRKTVRSLKDKLGKSDFLIDWIEDAVEELFEVATPEPWD